MTTEQTRIHGIIAVIAMLVSFYLSLIFGVWLVTQENIITCNVFPYISTFPVFLWVTIVCFIFLSTIFVTQPICEVLGLIILWVYCLFDKDCELYDDFKIMIIKEERPRYRSSGLFRGHHREGSSCRSSALSRRHHPGYDDGEDDM